MHLLDLGLERFGDQTMLFDHAESTEIASLHRDLVHGTAAARDVAHLNVRRLNMRFWGRKTRFF